METLVRERHQNGLFQSLDEFAARCDPKSLNRRQLEQLAAAGAFESLEPNRAKVFESADILLKHAHQLANEQESGQVSLFGGSDGSGSSLPPLPQVKAWDPLETLRREFDAVGFYLSAHPLDTKKEQLARLNIVSFADVEHMLQAQSAAAVKMAGVLLKKQEKVSQKGHKYAFIQLSDSSGVFEVTLFSELLAMTRSILEPGNTILLNVAAESREDQIRMTAQSIESLDKTLENKTAAIHILLEEAKPLEHLKQFLDIEGTGPSVILLEVPLGQGRLAEIQLPGRYALSAQARNILRAHEGVKELREL